MEGRVCGVRHPNFTFKFCFYFFNYVNAVILKQFKNKVMKNTYLKKDWYSKYTKLLKAQC